MKVGVFGAAGYGGVELLRLLAKHPQVELAYVSELQTGRPMSEFYPHLRSVCEAVSEESDVAEAAGRADVLFFCLQPGVGTTMVRDAVAGGKKVIDFSADFRLRSVDVYEAHYDKHAAPDLVGRAPYGLPELYRDEIRGADFVAVPGCHPTASILAAAPLVKEPLVDLSSIVIDSKTGISGVGRGHINLMNHYPEAAETVAAYSMPRHRHVPEMEQALGDVAGTEVKLTFAPSRVPMVRGILATVFATLLDPKADLQSAYDEFYADEPFVRVMPAGELPSTKHVAGMNYVDVAVCRDDVCGRAVAFGVVDNIIKGLSGAAVQCMNLMCGFDETTGLDVISVWP
ncbi:MAG: N-acetyl-gamma-glutamyl-phosphate reductase [Armatimonadota bacterium]